MTAAVSIRDRPSEDLEAELAEVRTRINRIHAYGILGDMRKLVELGAQRDALAFELLRRQNAAEARP